MAARARPRLREQEREIERLRGDERPEAGRDLSNRRLYEAELVKRDRRLERVRSIQRSSPTWSPIWVQRTAPPRHPVRAVVDLVPVRIANGAGLMRDRLARSRSVVEDDVLLRNLFDA